MKFYTLALLGLAAGIFLSACGGDPAQAKAGAAGGKPDDKDKKEEVAIPVEVADVISGDIEAAYRGTATLEAADEATVVAKTTGVVEQILVEEGEQVSTGQVLARLETNRLKLEVERAHANLKQLQQDFQRNESIYKQKLISREVYDRTRYEMEAAQAAYDLAALSLRESEIRAPFSGVVSARHIKLGNMIQTNNPVFRVTKLDSLEAHVFVPERDIYKLAAGHPAVLSVDAWPDQEFAGQVQRINPVVDPATGTVKVTVAMRDASAKLKPGMFGRVEIRYDRHEGVLLISKDAVLVEDAAESVFVVNAEGRALRRPIRTGYADADYYEVLDGLSAGEKVVTTGQTNLKDDTKVEIVETLVAVDSSI